MKNIDACERGSEWRVWDLHIHTPASFHWDGAKFNGTEEHDNSLTDQMIASMNDAQPAAYALMDYWTFDGWFALKKRLESANAPQLSKTVFPGIELRLVSPMNGRLNAHVIFSNEISDQHLVDFKYCLKLAITGQPLSDNALISYARAVGEDLLKRHGFQKKDVDENEATALRAGASIAEITVESYKDAIGSVPNGNALGFMPWSTNDGLEQVDWGEHYAYVLDLFQSSPIFETRKLDTWAAFAGTQTEGNKSWIASFTDALQGIPRLAVSGSDAHRFVGVDGDNNKRGYGQFPSNKVTWIKSDPTWLGLKQAIREPANRSFLGKSPDKHTTLQRNSTYFIDQVGVQKKANSSLSEQWLDGCNIKLSTDLVAIIGNKGSGKSALADIIALTGNSRQFEHFSFLKKDRFRGKTGSPAKHFDAELHWYAGNVSQINLAVNPDADKVELVKYIPQGRFEALCNNHVSGRSDIFEKELRSVIFDHIDPEIRLTALSFDELIEARESVFRARISELRQSLSTLNSSIVSTENKLRPLEVSRVDELLALKKQQQTEHLANKPEEVIAPEGEMTPEQQAASESIALLATEIDLLNEQIGNLRKTLTDMATKRRAVMNVQERLTILESQIGQFEDTTETDLKLLGLKLEDVFKIAIDKKSLTTILDELDTKKAPIDDEIVENTQKITDKDASKKELAQELNKPQREYQGYLNALREWNEIEDKLIGSPTEADSIKGLEAQQTQLKELPKSLKLLREKRSDLSKEISELLTSQRDDRGALFEPVQNIINDSPLIREDYQLSFEANLQSSYESTASKLFDVVKRNAGPLRGEEESIAAVRETFDKFDLNANHECASLAEAIYDLLDSAARSKDDEGQGLSAIMRKDRSVADLYDFIFGLEYISPQYSLKFQDTQIEQLSPGQRGALLLIFYLLVDKGRNPIILDQPEENLDNETVVSLLVPVLKEARKLRQIIMVTHNPNLAVVCDAEQIIHASIDRTDGPKISYLSGSIENPTTNKYVVDVLEGTKRAFDNRSTKYH